MRARVRARLRAMAMAGARLSWRWRGRGWAGGALLFGHLIERRAARAEEPAGVGGGTACCADGRKGAVGGARSQVGAAGGDLLQQLCGVRAAVEARRGETLAVDLARARARSRPRLRMRMRRRAALRVRARVLPNARSG